MEFFIDYKDEISLGNINDIKKIKKINKLNLLKLYMYLLGSVSTILGIASLLLKYNGGIKDYGYITISFFVILGIFYLILGYKINENSFQPF